jgi:YHS domain-containing protein
MKVFKTMLVAGLCGLSALAFAAKGEFGDLCALGLTMGKEVKTDCSINEMIGGKTYCFSSADAKGKFMTDAPGMLAKAEQSFVKMKK